ncbi:indolethylamine N-methyltransferase-like [Rhinophrynus dorsalis]
MPQDQNKHHKAQKGIPEKHLKNRGEDTCPGVRAHGKVKGETVLDISPGPSVYQLISTANVFKKIIVTESNDANIKEFKRWLNKEEGVADWSLATKFVCQLEGNREGWHEEEDKVRKAIYKVIKWNPATSRLDPTVIPPVDCVLSLWVLSVISKTKEEYQNALKNVALALKIGGHLLLFSTINMSYYMIGKHKFFMLKIDDTFIKESVINAGFVIEKQDLVPSKKGSDLVDPDHVLFILARKVKEM